MILYIIDLKGKKRRDGVGSPDKASTPSVPCEGIQQDMEGQKRPIINDEILALQIKEDDLMKVNLHLMQQLSLHTLLMFVSGIDILMYRVAPVLAI